MDTILLIDDDVELCSMLTDYLEKHGFQVEAVHRGDTGLKAATEKPYRMVLLDVMLPGIDGFEVLRRLRTASSVNVILLTARGEDIDRIVGLEIGADDYLPKPFNPRELLARIRAILRRSTQSDTAHDEATPSTLLKVAGIILDTSARSVKWHSTPVDVTDIEFGLLETLMRSPGEVVTRDHLAEVVLGRKFHPFDRSLDMHVSRLRRKLDEIVGMTVQIKTIRGTGYQLAVSSLRE